MSRGTAPPGVPGPTRRPAPRPAVRSDGLGPTELVQAAAAARRFYLEDRSKVEIAEELGLSRFKVARLLAAARAAGIVRIQVLPPTHLDAALSEQLRRTFGLRHAVVAATEEVAPTALRETVGRVAADLLSELAVADDVLGIAWGRSLGCMTRSLLALPPCTLVQLTGALPSPDVGEDVVELVRQAVAVGGGRGHTFHSPLFVPDSATAEVLRAQPGIREALDVLDHLSKAVVSIGAWQADDSTVYDALDPHERRRLARRGARAETTGVLFDESGTPVDGLADRVVGVTLEQLRRTPEVIALVYGDSKADAAVSVLRSGLVTSLVTHASLARRILADRRTADRPQDLP